MKRTGLLFTICAALLIALFANGAYILLRSRDGGQRQAPVPISDTAERKPQERKSSERLSAHLESSIAEERPINLMVLGLDRDETRCDVILLLQYDPAALTLNLLSVARDTRVKVNGSYCKINAVYSKGGEKLVAEELSEITGLPVHYYITADFEGFRKIIDTFGGVEFYVPFRMNYDDPTQNLHIHLKKGLQVLNGRKAEQLVRYRKGNRKGQGYSEGDIGRIAMQQDFVHAFIEQKLKFKYISKADELFEILNKYVKTNITLGDITRYLGDISKIKADEMQTCILPGYGRMIDGAWFYIYDRKETQELVAEHFRY